MNSTALLRSRWLEAMKRWHRYSVDGLEHLRTPGAKLLVAYHGRGIPLDLALLAEEVRKVEGYLPRSIVHAGLWEIPFFSAYLEANGCIRGDGPELRAAISRGESVFVAPGGTFEGLRGFWHRHEVDWGSRRGYLRLALELGVPLIPAATAGMDDRFIGLNDGHALGRRLKLPAKWPLWFALGPLGLYPFTPDFPVKFHTVIGAPIILSPPGDPKPQMFNEGFGAKGAVGDPKPQMFNEWIESTHAMMTARVQQVLDEATRKVQGG